MPSHFFVSTFLRPLLPFDWRVSTQEMTHFCRRVQTVKVDNLKLFDLEAKRLID